MWRFSGRYRSSEALISSGPLLAELPLAELPQTELPLAELPSTDPALTEPALGESPPSVWEGFRGAEVQRPVSVLRIVDLLRAAVGRAAAG